VAEVAHDTSTPLPMATLATQLFRLARASRGADADALEIYKNLGFTQELTCFGAAKAHCACGGSV
jgi:hypothetical protein